MKKVSVGDVRDVSPRKGKKKGIIILVVVAVILIALFLLGTTGCSSKKKSTTPAATPASPISILQTDVAGLTARVGYLEDHPVSPFDPSGLQSQIAVINTDIVTLNLGLASINVSGIQEQIAGLTYSLAVLESKWITMNATVYAHLAGGIVPTATPTPTPTYANCGVQRPSAISPSSGNISVTNGTVLFEWGSCSNAVRYEFWFGSDASSLLLAKNLSAPITFYTYPVPLSGTYYFWKVVAISPCNVTESDAWWFRTQ